MLVSKHNCELALRGAWVRHYQGILPEIPGRNLALTVLYYQMCLTWVGADLQRGSSTCVSLNSRLEINKGEEDDLQRGPGPPRHCHDARPVDLIITMIKWIRTSRLATKNSLSLPLAGETHACTRALRWRGGGRLDLAALHHAQFKNKYFTEMCSGSEAGSYLRLVDFCITQL